MRLVVDAHTHTISSGHAYSTIQEMAEGAQANEVEMFAMTDHGPAIKGAPCLNRFPNLKEIPKILHGVRVLKGVEANIIDYSGKTDMPDEYLKNLDYAIASFHELCIKSSCVEEHTACIVNVMKNPYIDAVGHPGNPYFQVDVETVVKAVKDNGKLIEINNPGCKGKVVQNIDDVRTTFYGYYFNIIIIKIFIESS